MTTVEIEKVSAPPIVREGAREQRASILEAAALEIEVRGRACGEAEDEHGAVCLVGALALAQGRPSQDWEFCAVEDVFWGHRRCTDDLWLFNDSNAANEVTFLLRWRAQEIRDGR
jgi:hypothetical protein